MRVSHPASRAAARVDMNLRRPARTILEARITDGMISS